MVGRTINYRKNPVRIDSADLVMLLAALSSLLTLTACQNGPIPLSAEVPLHLEDHLDTAIITGSDVPGDVPEPVEWRFDEPQPDWKPVVPLLSSVEPAKISRTDNSMRITLNEAHDYKRRNRTFLNGAVYINVPNWRREECLH